MSCLYAGQLGRVIACDRNLEADPRRGLRGAKAQHTERLLLGAADRDGNLYVCDLQKGTPNATPSPDCMASSAALARTASSTKTFADFLVGGGLALDSKGCLYVSDTARMGFMDAVHNWAIGRGPKWKRGEAVIRSQSDLAYLVKFPPGARAGSDAEIWAHRGVSRWAAAAKSALFPPTA